MKITLEFKTMDDIKIFQNVIWLAHEMAHDRGDGQKEEELLYDLWQQTYDQIKEQ